MLTKIIIENTLIILGEGFWLLSNASQLHKLFKTRNAKGLSAVSQTLNAAGNAAWITYFASHKLWVPVLTNLSMMILTTIVLGYTLGNRKQFIRGIITIVILAPITSYVIIKYPLASGWLAVIYNTIAASPQLIKIVVNKRVSGISEKSFFFSLGAMLCTLIYAVMIGSLPLICGVSIGFIFLIIVMSYYYRYRKHD
ncbi:MAG TPA: PQ-loop domain-containing transporter [Candidatus Saccharimonadales bacterium]